MKLTRRDILDGMKEWIRDKMPSVKLPDGNVAKRAVVNIAGRDILVKSTFLNETYANNKDYVSTDKLDLTLRLARELQDWLPTAKWTMSEMGKHNKGWYDVYETIYKGEKIRALVKSETGVLYTMRLN